MKKFLKTLVLLVIVVVVVIGVVTFVKKSDDKYQRPSYGHVAAVYHSVMRGIDAGNSYAYYIYKSNENDNTYFYIKAKRNITIAGDGKEEDVSSGSLKDKKDLKKIVNDIDKDSIREAESYISYSFLNNGENENCLSIEDLGTKLFKQ